MKRNSRLRRERPQFFHGVIDQALHVLRIKLAFYDTEGTPGFRCSLKSRRGPSQSLSDLRCSCVAIRNHSRFPSFVLLFSRYLALCGLASVLIGTCSIISRPYPSRPTPFFGLFVRNRNCRTPRSKRICAPRP